MSEATVIDQKTGRALRRLNPECFSLGAPLPGAICDVHGRVLMPAGWPLSADDVHKLRGQLRRGVFGGDGWSDDSFLKGDAPPPVTLVTPQPNKIVVPNRGELVPVGIETLYVGKNLVHPVYNRNGVLLLAAGMEVTHRFLGRLRQLGMCEVHIPADTIADRYQPTAGRIRIERELDNVVENLRRTEINLTGRVLPRRDLPLARLREEMERAGERYLRSVDDVAEIAADVLRGRASSVSGASEVLTPFMEMTSADSSLLPIVARLKDTPGEYLYHHGLNVALLAMAAAARLGVRKEILLEIGLGALLQDVGMLRIDESVRLAPRPLTPDERMQVHEHPHYTLDLLHTMEGIGSVSMLICYQAHERADGKGYPRNRVRKQIHPFARLVALADVYTAVASHRPYRAAFSPYGAMETILRETARNQFDAEVMRNFLNSLSLFPIGSRVRLSTGETARVLRANPGSYTLPVVLLHDGAGAETDTEIDLAATQYAHVVGALG
ncbi:MAG TPA: HD domain-containing phosphohydrolase [Phycisphaerae bacterium]|nr:HD domain-containing phosphohydrolase [Phycisphaerae bacterium]